VLVVIGSIFMFISYMPAFENQKEESVIGPKGLLWRLEGPIRYIPAKGSR